MPTRQALLSSISDEFRNQPNDVSVVEIMAWIRTGTSDRVKEWAVYCNGNLGTPPPQRRRFDL